MAVPTKNSIETRVRQVRDNIDCRAARSGVVARRSGRFIVTLVRRPTPFSVDARFTRSKLRSGRASFVTMVESTNLRHFHDPAKCGRLDRAGDRRVFVECQVRARSVVVLDVRAQ